MKAVSPALLIIILSATSLSAQIYADFAVSQGDTPLGTFRARLDHDKAPRPVAAFIGLATGQRNWIDGLSGRVMSNTPYYDGQIFHRLDHDFVLQGGDPLGTGGGGPGYVIQDQYHADLRHDGRYFLSMAKSSRPNSNGSQFFITLGRASDPTELGRLKALDDLHSVFGEVINDPAYPDSRTLIDNFADPDLFPTTGESPQIPLNLDSVVISGPSLASFDIHDPALLLPAVREKSFTPVYDGLDRFDAKFPREAQREYSAQISIDDLDLAPFRVALSMDEDPDYEFVVTGVTFDRFFMRFAEVDYSLLPNAPNELRTAGGTFTLTDRAGDLITFVFDDPALDTGTWSDSLGNSGILTGVAWDGTAPDTGVFVNTFSQAAFIPLGLLSANFDGPAGSRGITELDLTVSFHTPTSGWVESTNFLPDGKRLFQSFTYVP